MFFIFGRLMMAVFEPHHHNHVWNGHLERASDQASGSSKETIAKFATLLLREKTKFVKRPRRHGRLQPTLAKGEQGFLHKDKFHAN